MSEPTKWQDYKNKRPLTEGENKIYDRVVDEMNQEQLVYNLAELRRLCGVTQVELAKRLNISQAGVSNIENSTDSKLSTIKELTEALGAKLEIYADLDGEKIKLTSN